MENKIKHLLFTSLLLSLMLFSLGASAGSDIPLNHCIPQIASKRYIGSDFSTKYPRAVKFECTYECNVDNRIEYVLAIKDVRVNNIEDDARMTACQGVQVKKVSWGYDFDKIVPFYAFDTEMIEMKRFAFESINQKNQTETKYLKELQKNLSTVAAAYQSTGVPYFVEASLQMSKIAAELPGKTTLLDKYIKEIVTLKGEVPPMTTSQGMVLINIKTHAAWRIPGHLFRR